MNSKSFSFLVCGTVRNVEKTLKSDVNRLIHAVGEKSKIAGKEIIKNPKIIRGKVKSLSKCFFFKISTTISGFFLLVLPYFMMPHTFHLICVITSFSSLAKCQFVKIGFTFAYLHL